ncbi:MAG: acyl carrier protein phosphodiesterase [Bacteroidetes bacterium]|nr:acyl carrier protein phosphodiesterase [Bacteroidota bacterium]MBU1577892.1 acyl carrier protein phosphodiesterase [Bacteroidota bacterium]MBU2466749.1 acyl carrier protein phosphodiesterase [Bacteroidota bacterium]MBU2558474.1 acyl carrier protein phosphodiesterase [Bacteroidota bacterium]
MNFLAHAFLSGNNSEVLFGNFVADSIKGKMIAKYSGALLQGVQLHRAIDLFTDQHPVVKQSINRLKPEFLRFSPVIVDIYYDHFLAANWSKYSSRDLSEFSVEVYRILLRNYSKLPPRSKRILPWMMAQNWLTGYANLQDLQRVFGGMSRRTKFDSGMEHAVEFLKLHYQDFEQEFDTFFPDLIAESERVLSEFDSWQ